MINRLVIASIFLWLVFVTGFMGLQVMFNKSQTRFNGTVVEFQGKVIELWDVHFKESHGKEKP